MTLLKDYIKQLQKIAEQHPSFPELPIIYSHDDEGNQYQKVSSEPELFIVDNIKNYYLEAELTVDVDNKPEDFNCVKIN